MDRTEVTCIDTGNTIGADVLEQSAMRIKVVIDGTDTAIQLYKETPTSLLYIGHAFGMEFTTTGE